MFVERAVFRGVGQVQIGDQRKISLLSNHNWQSLSDRVKMDFQECKCLGIQSSAVQIDKFLFNCTEKSPKPAMAVNTSSSETFSQNNLELEKAHSPTYLFRGGIWPPVMGLSEGPHISMLQFS